MSIAFWSFMLRFGQAGMDAALTLLIGVLTAGIFRRMIGPQGIRRLFGSGPRGLVTGWLAGMLLPVCALGVIPVARELRRSGVPGGSLLAFVLAAPLLNPLSFLYGLTLAEPVVILSFAGASLLLSTVAGLLWEKIFARLTDATTSASLAAKADAEPMPPFGIKRMIAVLSTAMKELSGRDLIFYVIGLSGTALLSAVIPFGALQHTMHYSDKWSPMLMTGLAVPLFSSPLPGMMIIGLMFDHGNSIGAAFVLFAIGIGTSLGTIVWLLVDFNWRRVLPWFVAYVVVVVGVGYACDSFLYDQRKAESDHTHAFDDYASPFPDGIDLIPVVARKLKEKFGPLEQQAVYGFLGMLVGGIVIRRLDTKGRLETWLTTQPKSNAKQGQWDIIIPGPVLGGLCLVGLVAFSILGAYVYYPARDECMEQMFAVYAEAAVAIRTAKPDLPNKSDEEKKVEEEKKTAEAIRQLELWDQLVRKLEVGTYLRNFGVTSDQAKTAELLREAIEEVRDELLAKNIDGALQKFKSQVDPAYKACKEAYQ